MSLRSALSRPSPGGDEQRRRVSGVGPGHVPCAVGARLQAGVDGGREGGDVESFGGVLQHGQDGRGQAFRAVVPGKALSMLRGCAMAVAAVRSCPETSPMSSTRVSSAWMTASLAVTGTCSGRGSLLVVQEHDHAGVCEFRDDCLRHRGDGLVQAPTGHLCDLCEKASAQCGAPCVLDVVGRGDPFLRAAVAKDGHTPRRHMTVRAVGSPHPERCLEQPRRLLGEGGMPLLW